MPALFLIDNRIILDSMRSVLYSLGESESESENEIRISAKTESVLIALCTRRNQMVTRTVLIADVWRLERSARAENLLNQAVWKIRNSFEALGGLDWYIKTIPRIGFIFLPEVNVITQQDVVDLPKSL